MKNFADLTEREVLAVAIASEEEDSRIYMSFAEDLAARYPEAPLSHTSLELLRDLRGQRFVAHDRLARVLTDADLIKFARRPVSGDRARELGREARAIVTDEHAASQVVPAVEKAA